MSEEKSPVFLPFTDSLCKSFCSFPSSIFSMQHCIYVYIINKTKIKIMYIVYMLHLSVNIGDIFRFFWFLVARLSSYYPSIYVYISFYLYFQSSIYSNVQLGEFLHGHTPTREDHCPSWSYIILWSLSVHNLPVSTN